MARGKPLFGGARRGGLARRLSRFVGRRCFSAGLISPAKLRSKYLMDPSWTPFIGTPYAVIATLIGAYLGVLWFAAGNLLAPITTHAFYDFVAPVYFLRAHVPSTGRHELRIDMRVYLVQHGESRPEEEDPAQPYRRRATRRQRSLPSGSAASCVSSALRMARGS